MSLEKNSKSAKGLATALALGTTILAIAPGVGMAQQTKGTKASSESTETRQMTKEELAKAIENAVTQALQSLSAADLNNSALVQSTVASAIATAVQGQPVTVVQAAMTIAAPAIVNSVQTVVVAATGSSGTGSAAAQAAVTQTVNTVKAAVQATVTQVQTVVAQQVTVAQNSAPATVVNTSNFNPPTTTTGNTGYVG